MTREPIQSLNDGIDKIDEALVFLDLLYLAGLHDKDTNCFSVGSQRAIDLIRAGLGELNASAKLLRGEAA